MKTENQTCLSCPLTSCLVKRNSHLANMEAFISKRKQLHCKKGQSFILEGAPVHGLYFLQQGKVKVFKTGLHGKEQIVRLVGEGELIGHRGFGTSACYQVGATALENATLCSFSMETMQEMLECVPSMTMDLMKFYAEELSKSETKVKKFAQMTVREKVIDAFLYINRKFGHIDGFLNIRLSRKEIADFAGTTDEQVTRTISSLKKDGLLRVAGKKLGIVSVPLLGKEIAEHNYFIDS